MIVNEEGARTTPSVVAIGDGPVLVVYLDEYVLLDGFELRLRPPPRSPPNL